MKKMNILAVGAHPDDLEILCGGTLALYARAGHRVFMAHLCSGCMGGRDIEPDKLAALRDREAKASAALVGAETLGPVAGDLDIYPDRETRRKVVGIVRRARPDIIITHDESDYMADHVATARVVFDAAFTATLPLFETEEPVHEQITPIYAMDTVAGLGFEPAEFVDITAVMETKRRMFLAHESQYKWLEEHHAADPLALIEKTAAFRGLQCGVEHAEAFRPVMVWGRAPTRRLLP